MNKWPAPRHPYNPKTVPYSLDKGYTRDDIEEAMGSDFCAAIFRVIRHERGKAPDLSDDDFRFLRIQTPAQRLKNGYTSAADAQRIGDPGGATKAGFAQRMRGIYPVRSVDNNMAHRLTKAGARAMDTSEYCRLTGLTLPPAIPAGSMIYATIVEELTFENVLFGYRLQYADPLQCDDIGGWAFAHLLDHAVLAGVSSAIICAQKAVGASPDGVMGPATLSALKACDPDTLAAAIARQRLADLASKANWARFKTGWTARVNDPATY